MSIFEHKKVIKSIIAIFPFSVILEEGTDDITITGDFDIKIFVFPFTMLGKFSIMAFEDIATRYHYEETAFTGKNHAASAFDTTVELPLTAISPQRPLF